MLKCKVSECAVSLREQSAGIILMMFIRLCSDDVVF